MSCTSGTPSCESRMKIFRFVPKLISHLGLRPIPFLFKNVLHHADTKPGRGSDHRLIDRIRKELPRFQRDLQRR